LFSQLLLDVDSSPGLALEVFKLFNMKDWAAGVGYKHTCGGGEMGIAIKWDLSPDPEPEAHEQGSQSYGGETSEERSPPGAEGESPTATNFLWNRA